MKSLEHMSRRSSDPAQGPARTTGVLFRSLNTQLPLTKQKQEQTPTRKLIEARGVGALSAFPPAAEPHPCGSSSNCSSHSHLTDGQTEAQQRVG